MVLQVFLHLVMNHQIDKELTSLPFEVAAVKNLWTCTSFDEVSQTAESYRPFAMFAGTDGL